MFAFLGIAPMDAEIAAALEAAGVSLILIDGVPCTADFTCLQCGSTFGFKEAQIKEGMVRRAVRTELDTEGGIFRNAQHDQAVSAAMKRQNKQ